MTDTAFKSMMEPFVLDNMTSKRAWEKAWEIGLPTKKTESFKRHNVQSIFSDGLRSNQTLVLKEILPQGVRSMPFKQAKDEYAVFLQNISSKFLQKEKNIFPILNEACCDNGLFFHVTSNVQEPVWIEDLVTTSGSISLKRMVIYVAKGKSIDLVLKRKYTGKVNSNFLIDVVVEDGGSCRMIDLNLEGSSEACSMMHVRAQVKKGAVFRHYFANRGGAMCRMDLFAELLGERSEVDLQGVWLLKDKLSSHTEIRIEHKAPNTRSNQHYKGVLKDKSLSTFEGKIYIEPQAQKTEAYQLNNNLILDNGACAFSKPNLEIFADDVKASHGATITELNEDEIFYLRTRGINTKRAKDLLTAGFTKAIVARFFDKQAKRDVYDI